MFVLSPLARPSIRRLWIGQVLAATGAEFYMVAIVWIAVDMIGSDAGYMTALQAVALLAGSMFGGVVTDRWRHGRTMIAADLGRAALALTLPLAHALGWLSAWWVVLVAAASAMLTAFFDPALQATVPVLAPDPGLRHATNGLFDVTRRLARIAGPGLIAVVGGILPTIQFFTVTAGTFLTSAAAVRSVTGRLDEEAPVQGRGLTGALDSLTAGFRALKGQPVLIYGLISSFCANATFAGGYTLGMVLLMRATQPRPLVAYGLMAGAYGVGNVLSNIVIASRRPGNPAFNLTWSRVIYGAGMTAMALAPSLPVLMVAAALTAINGPMADLALLNLLQSGVAPRDIARVYRVRLCFSCAGMLAGSALAPTLFQHLNVRDGIVVLSMLSLAVGLAGMVLRARAPARMA